jgi:cytochrome b involved in lipid metabolism
MATTLSSVSSEFHKSGSNGRLDVDDSADESSANSESAALPVITMDEVGEHYTQNDAWMVIYDKVYDFTHFMDEVRNYHF